MSHTTILPTPGDPILLQYWLAHYRNVGCFENLHVIINSTAIKQPYMRHLERIITASGGTYETYSHSKGHGEMMKEVLYKKTQDTIVFLEDDIFLLKKDELQNIVQQGEKALVLGSPRGGYTKVIEDAGKRKYGEIQASRYDNGLGLWPGMLFIKRRALQSAATWIDKYVWNGKVPGLDTYVIGERCDTFTAAAVALRAKYHEQIQLMPSYHTHPYDLQDEMYKQYLHDAPFLHIGSLSSGVDGYIADEYGRPLHARSILTASEGKHRPAPTTDMEKYELEKRVAVWLMAYDYQAWHGQPEFADFAKEYKTALDSMIQRYNLKSIRIQERQDYYKSLGML